MPLSYQARLGDRSLFPTLRASAYLSHCAISPLSAPAQEAANAYLSSFAEHGLGAFMGWMEQRDDLKASLGSLLNTAPENLALVPNTTSGVVSIATCFPWKKGDKIVVFEGEFPTNVTPWQRAAAQHELEIIYLSTHDFLEDHATGLEKLETALKNGVRLVAVSAVQFQTGLRMPLDAMTALCHQHKAQIFVDAIQALGAVPVDLQKTPVDYLTAGSHKFLMGTEGLAVLYAAPSRAPELQPHLAGWLSHEEGLRFLFEGSGHLRYDRPIRQSLDFLESGAPNAAGAAVLGASLELIQQVGVDAIYQHINLYLDALEEGLQALGLRSHRYKEPVGRSAILSLSVPEGKDVLTLGQGLNEKGIACTTPDGLLRFAPHWPNARDEVPGILKIVEEELHAQS